MWAIANLTPFGAASTAVIDKHGARHWIVAVKATFDVNPNGTTTLSEDQLEPSLVPEYRGEPGISSLLSEADLIDEKPATDILVNGTAYAPGAKPCTQVNVGLRVGGVQKTLTVYGDRVYERGLVGQPRPSSPKPFLEMPIVYERAYGGFDKSSPDPRHQKLFAPNPVGTGVVSNPRQLVGSQVANVEFPDGKVRSDSSPGFGALCSYWEPRRRYQGTYDADWVKSRKPLLPLDYDPRVNMCAPLDQQIEPHWVAGGAEVGLMNMTPSGVLRFTLPKVFLAFTTHFAGYSKRAPVEHRAKLHTVLIEPDYPRVRLVWHSRVSCGNAIDDIDRTTIVEKQYV